MHNGAVRRSRRQNRMTEEGATFMDLQPQSEVEPDHVFIQEQEEEDVKPYIVLLSADLEEEGDTRYPERQKSARKKLPSLSLGRAQQEAVASWFQANPCLYDKGDELYKIPAEEKNAMWEQKALELAIPGVDGARLKRYVDGVRTDYGKLSRHPSRANGSLSWRNKWILEKWSFLHDHIYRKGAQRDGVRADFTCAMFQDRSSRKRPEREVDTDPEGGYPSPANGESTQTKKRRTERDEGDNDDRLTPQSSRPQSAHDEVTDRHAPRDGQAQERQAFATWFNTVASQLHESLWDEFESDCYHLLRTFRQRNRRLQGHPT